MTADTDSTRARVVLEDPERQSLLGLLLYDVLRANLRDDTLCSRLRGARGIIEVTAGEMTVTLKLGDGQIAIVGGPAERPGASVRGRLAAFLGVVLGGGLVAPVLSGAIAVRGNPFLLLKLLPLMRAPRPGDGGAATGERR